ncbi:hypothetical protein TUM4644_33280 [Shewanella colwelliana]|uniref:hypothetical protein n=1 Tax=Shewanella colwelliana TaxID=23 RepID=UPI001BC1DDC1|nr:hypothetical protein [Shewanella colwelliana]GIU32891.1 hypothetical protein TUM4644_33280 [Shewanella colwelliana]
MNERNKKARRFYERNKSRLAERRQYKKKFNDFMTEIAGQWLKHDAEFLASYVMKNKEHSTELVAETYKTLVDDLQLTEQRENAVNNPAFYKALTARLNAIEVQ